ncbi:MAG: hypothetical protein FWC73_11410 [Defluviitaleaceae bacterium]|nr:hypothetical protein [Defluviitaleaceae bacterium]
MSEKTTVLHVNDIPLTESGEPDVAAILAANDLGHIDLTKAKVIKVKTPDDVSIPEGTEPTVIQLENPPLTESGQPDIAAILAANDLGHIDLTKAKVMMVKTDE